MTAKRKICVALGGLLVGVGIVLGILGYRAGERSKLFVMTGGSAAAVPVSDEVIRDFERVHGPRGSPWMSPEKERYLAGLYEANQAFHARSTYVPSAVLMACIGGLFLLVGRRRASDSPTSAP